jgi:ferritin
MKRTLNQEQQIEKILSEISKIQTNSSDKKIANILENVKKELNCLI